MVKDYVPPKTEKKEMMCILITHIQHSERSSSHGNKTKKKRNKIYQIAKEKNPIAEYNVDIQKSITFLHSNNEHAETKIKNKI